MASKLVTFRIPEDLYRDFQKQCARDRITVSKQLRRFVDDFLYPITSLEATEENASESGLDTSSQDGVSYNTVEEWLHNLLHGCRRLNKRLHKVEKRLFEPSQFTKTMTDANEEWLNYETDAKEVDKLFGGHWSEPI